MLFFFFKLAESFTQYTAQTCPKMNFWKMLKSPPYARKWLLVTSHDLGGHSKTFWNHLRATCVLAQKHSYLNGQSPEVCVKTLEIFKVHLWVGSVVWCVETFKFSKSSCVWALWCGVVGLWKFPKFLCVWALCWGLWNFSQKIPCTGDFLEAILGADVSISPRASKNKGRTLICFFKTNQINSHT